MSLRLTAGRFFGACDAKGLRPGIEVASLKATAAEADVHPHVHEAAHFILVLDGTYISTAAGAPMVARAPFLVFNPAGTEHRDRFLEGRGRFLALTLFDVAVGQGIQTLALPKTASRITSAVALQAAYRLERLVRRDEGGLALEESAWRLLGAASTEPTSATQCDPRWLQIAFELVMDGGLELTIADISACAGIHPVHMARVFKRAFGLTPSELLRRRRLERAADLVAHSEAPLARIAVDTGFVDQSHLTHAFRTAFRTTPAAFRRERHVARLQDRGRQRS